MEDPTRSSQSQADDLEGRLIAFAVRIVKLSGGLPRTPAGKHIAGQIMRSGTSPAQIMGKQEARRVMLTSFISCVAQGVEPDFDLAARHRQKPDGQKRVADGDTEREYGVV
jgi:hypothetical protein